MDGMSGTVTIGIPEEGNRIDTFLSAHLSISRSKAQEMITGGFVTINDMSPKKNRILSAGDEIEWKLPPPGDVGVIPEAIPVDVMYEDEHIVVIDKKAGVVMYPGPGHGSGTLLNALINKYPEMNNVGGKGRSGIFHRLDKDTSGLVAIARSEQAYQEMVRKMKSREVKRDYIALVNGFIPADKGIIDAPMGRSKSDRKKMAVDHASGRKAVSRFKVIERFPQGYSLVSVSLETGRTHQIRVHFAHIGFPVVGDKTYSRGKGGIKAIAGRQFLHASELKFMHPVTGETIDLKSGLPDDLAGILDELHSNK